MLRYHSTDSGYQTSILDYFTLWVSIVPEAQQALSVVESQISRVLDGYE